MDEAEGGAGGGYGNSGDPGDNFTSVEAISAVADDGFLGEEDDDYEDLYNDVNVGEGFLQSLRKNEENKAAAASSAPVVDPQVPAQLPASASAGEASRSTISGVGGVGEGTKKLEIDMGIAGGDSRVSGSRLGEYQNQGFGGSDVHMTAPHGAGMGPGSGPSGGGVGGPYGGGAGAGDGLRVQLGQPSTKAADVGQQTANTSSMAVQGAGLRPSHDTDIGNTGNNMARQLGGGGSVNGTGGTMMGGGGVGAMGAGGGGGGGGNGTILFVGELHWWTTDAELEAELVKYGSVKEVKFFDEKASGKSKGYCQVEFYDSAAATACKEGMNGHAFNGRPCVVAYASPFTVKKMGEAQVNKNQQMGQQSNSQVRRGPNDVGNRPSGNNIATGGNYQGADNNRGYGRGNWGRGNAQMGNRGPVGPIRNRPGGMGGRGMMPNAGNGFGQGMGATPPMMHPQPMMGQGFDPAFGGPMGRMGNFGGYPGGPGAPFQGMMPNFPPVASVGLPGVAPHVNPAFFGRGMPMNGMGMMPNSGVDGPNMGMWSDPNMAMGGWAGDEHAMRAAESSYGEDAVSEHHYGEVSHDRVGRPSAMKEKERGGERDWSGSSDRRYRDDREPGYDREAPREKDLVLDQDLPGRRHRDVSRERDRERDRERGRSRDRERDRERDLGRDKERDKDRYRDDRERYADHHRSRDREPDYDEEWDRGRPSRTHSKSRMEEERPRSRDPDYGKRRRLTSS